MFKTLILINRAVIFAIFFAFSHFTIYSQCSVNVDTANISHIICPEGGSVGSAQIIQATYLNYSWQNTSNGQLYNGGGGNGGTNRYDLDAGYYVITASSPYAAICPDTIYSDTFQIRMPIVDLQPVPTQACPNLCDVELNVTLIDPILPNIYSYSIDNSSILPIVDPATNLCGGPHIIEIFANGQSCGVNNFGISQFAPMILSNSVIDASCNQLGSATVNIDGVGASQLNNYCASSPQYINYSTIDNVELNGDSISIINNTLNNCSDYSDYTNISADLTPGNTYTLNLSLGTCHPSGFALVDIASVYIDWNIDGDFDDINELVAEVSPTQSPSNHIINFTVPINSVPGFSRLRIVMQNNDYQPNNLANACDFNTAWFGETEDYSILINGSVATPVVYSWSNGQTSQTATGLIPGTYFVTVTDANNCSSTDTVYILGNNNVSLNTSQSQTICNGSMPSQLTASSNVSGTYSWYPSIYLDNANISNPNFISTLTATTDFIVTFTAPGCILSDTVTIYVNPIPAVSVSVLPSIACLNDNIVVTANTSIPVIRYRFQYNIGAGWQNIITTNNGGWGTLNPIIYNNITASTQFRVRVREDWGCTISSWSPVITVPVSQYYTPPISHN